MRCKQFHGQFPVLERCSMKAGDATFTCDCEPDKPQKRTYRWVMSFEIETDLEEGERVPDLVASDLGEHGFWIADRLAVPGAIAAHLVGLRPEYRVRKLALAFKTQGDRA